jgi:hypothetical protein
MAAVFVIPIGLAQYRFMNYTAMYQGLLMLSREKVWDLGLKGNSRGAIEGPECDVPGASLGALLFQRLLVSFTSSLRQPLSSHRIPRRNMADGPNPFDAKYAPGAEQARQNVMVGVSVAMTSIGGESSPARHAKLS